MCSATDDPTMHDRDGTYQCCRWCGQPGPTREDCPFRPADSPRAPEEIVRAIARVNGLSIERARPIADGLCRQAPID